MVRSILSGFILGIFMVSAAFAADYNFLDKNLNYKGYMHKGDTRIDFYDKHNMPSGWIDRSSGARYDGHNNFRGWVIDSDNRSE